MEYAAPVISITLSVLGIMIVGLTCAWLVMRLFPSSTRVLGDGYLVLVPGRRAVHVDNQTDLTLYIKATIEDGRPYRVFSIKDGEIFEIPF